MTTSPQSLEIIRNTISKLTGARYEIRKATSKFPPPSDSAPWYVFAPELMELSKTAHATTIWEDNNGNIYVESNFLGDTWKWVESDYGEEGAIAAGKMDFTDFAGVRKAFAELFPSVDECLREYENILTEVSSKGGVRLQMRYDQGKGGAVFYMNAKIDAKGLDLQSKLGKIKLNVDALKEASDRINEHEARRSEMRQMGHAHELLQEEMEKFLT